ncbi:MAG: MATE family efflux transporter [Lachnospiraceae bacterium]|nr:MATE family efflux transporter [Lachnospiraceae bacterium]
MKTTNMTEGNPFKTIFFFAVPMIISNLFQQFYNVIDTLIVGKCLGQDALAAVGSASSITAVFVQLATGLALGGAIVISQYFGAGKGDKIRICATTMACFSTVVGLVSTVLMWMYAEPLLDFVNTPSEIIPIGVDYLRFYFLGSVPIFLYNALSSVYTALGNSKAPLKFLIISSAVNVILDLVFIVNFQWGVAGAAAATAISQLLAMALAFLDIPKLLVKFPVKKAENGRKVFFDGKLLLLMLRYALPSAIQQSIVSVGSVVVQATINSFGSAVMAGTAAAAKVINLAIAIPINYSNAYSGYVGQNMGAGKTERIWPGLKSSLVCCGLISLGMTAVLTFFAEPIIGMFLSDTDADIAKALAVGTEYIRVVGACLIVFTGYMMVKATFKGSGDMGWFILTTLLSFVIRLLVTVGLAGKFGVDVIWWGFNLGWIISLVLAVMRYVQGGWKKKALAGQNM